MQRPRQARRNAYLGYGVGKYSSQGKRGEMLVIQVSPK
jgi:uncharacterized protein YebE (UPF0316 family)